MISSVFGKTKPISYIIVLSFLFLFYLSVYFFLFPENISQDSVFLQVLFLAVLLLSIFVINFIVSRNKLTGTNTYTILIYSLFIVLFPEVISDGKAILCNFFILLATRRLVSIKSLMDVKNKIFDATLWIGMASLLYDWALLYMLLVLITIWLYQPRKVKNWLVPLAGIFSLAIIGFGILTFIGDADFFKNRYVFSVHNNIGIVRDWKDNLLLIIYILGTVITIFFAFLKLGKRGLGRIVSLRLILMSFIIGIVVMVLEEFPEPLIILTFVPAAVFVTNYIESIKRPNIKEVLLISSVVIPFGLLIIRFLIK
ncbi:MAG: hypothetical protein COA50_04460 [Flavobacteriaceae bacterium]|nr:MAG: hypothetical protein COA50_04460 [Flavobacteriaceae bacterium]